MRDAVPYIARVDPRDGAVWIGTAAADALLRYHPKTGTFDVFPLPSRGALVRHLAIDAKRVGGVARVWGFAGHPCARRQGGPEIVERVKQ